MPKNRQTSYEWRTDDAVEENARVLLPRMARDYFEAGRRIVAKNPDPADLHPFRLETKRFRYTLEMFREVYGPSLERRLEELKPVQTALGEVNDCVATAEAFPRPKAFTRYLDKRAQSKAKDFFRSWTEEFDAEGNEAHWIRYLARGLRTRKPVASETRPTRQKIESEIAVA